MRSMVRSVRSMVYVMVMRPVVKAVMVHTVMRPVVRLMMHAVMVMMHSMVVRSVVDVVSIHTVLRPIGPAVRMMMTLVVVLHAVSVVSHFEIKVLLVYLF